MVNPILALSVSLFLPLINSLKTSFNNFIVFDNKLNGGEKHGRS